MYAHAVQLSGQRMPRVWRAADYPGRVGCLPVAVAVEYGCAAWHKQIVVLTGSWHGVVARAAPWMAAAYPPDGKPQTLYRTVPAYSLDGILAACGREPARVRQQRRQTPLVNPYREYERPHGYVT